MDDVPASLPDVISILNSGAALLIAFLSLAGIQQANKPGNRWLGVFMLCIFFFNVDFILMMGGIKIESIFIIIASNISACLFAPVFYYAVSYFIAPGRPWKIKDYFHLLSFALFYLLFSFYLLHEKPELARQGSYFLTELFSSSFVALFCLQFFYYCTLSWIKLKKHEQNIQLFNSTIETIDLRWLRHVVVSVLVIAVFFIIEILSHFPNYCYVILELSYLAGFFAIAYFSIRQKEIYPFTAGQKNEIISVAVKESSGKQEPRRLIEDNELAELKAAMLHLMENEKPFLDSELTLVRLASMMDISLHQLSYLINTGFGENFYQFVNRYRIEEAKKLILDDEMGHLNFQGIASEAGFNSKSAFNAAFKKFTGLTPSEYKMRQYESAAETSPYR